MTLFYDHKDLADLVEQGGSVGASGTYGIWLWAKEGARLNLTVGGTTFPTVHGGPVTGRWSWARVGEVDLWAGERFSVGIEVPHAYFAAYEPDRIGHLVLTDDRTFDPARSLELMRVFTEEAGPVEDRRVTDIRHGDRVYTMPAYRTVEEWTARATELRRHILVSTGLWPLPERTPLNARIFGRIEREGYTVEKVYFESIPGFLVTGNLYRPRDRGGSFPGVVCPHGHWGMGRLENTEIGSIPGRCIHFARQGYVVFSYDMVGYNDSRQVDHRYGGDPRQNLWGISLMGLQLWNSIRVVDFLTSLEEVDPERIGCTGASGGGTQTFMLTAVDERIQVAAPVNMISAHFQGGCLCENSPNLRIDTFNVEIGALMAPRPLLLVSCTGDWTKNTPQVEFPAIQSIYRLFGAEEKVQWVQIEAGHNYNRDSREAVYAWFGRWILGDTEQDRFKEGPFEMEKKEDLLVFYDRPLPEGALNAEGLTRALIGRAEHQLSALKPCDEEGLRRFRDIMRPTLRHTLSVDDPEPEDLSVERKGTTQRSDVGIQRLLIGRSGQGDRLPAVLYRPVEGTPPMPGTVVVHPSGKAALVDATRGVPGALVRGLLDRGHIVLAVDAFLTGEFHPPYGQTQRDTGVRYVTTFNPTDLALRVQDILTALAYLRGREDVQGLHLVGLERAGLWCLLTRGIAKHVDRTVVDMDQLDTGEDEGYTQDLWVPGLRRAGDFRTAGALTAPAELFLHATGGRFDPRWIADVYRAVHAEDRLRIQQAKATTDEILGWLTQEQG